MSLHEPMRARDPIAPDTEAGKGSGVAAPDVELAVAPPPPVALDVLAAAPQGPDEDEAARISEESGESAVADDDAASASEAGASETGESETGESGRGESETRESVLGESEPDAFDTDEDTVAVAEAAEQAASDAVPSGAVETEAEFHSLKRHHVAPAMVAIDRIDDDPTFQVRDEGDVSQLATDLARLGQLFPVDLRLKGPDRFQIICGFRRVAALRFLQRDRVLARLHTELSDEDALLMALASAIHAQPVTAEELEAVKERLESEGKLTAATRSMIEKALAPEDELAPESVEGEEEVDADELAGQVTVRLGEINQDLSLLAGVFDSLDEAKRAELLEQLRYASELVEFLEGRK